MFLRIRDIGILLVIIIVVYGVFVYRFGYDMTHVNQAFTENFQSNGRGIGYGSGMDASTSESTEVSSKIDLETIRKNFSETLALVDASSHDDPRSSNRSVLRVGLERLITEIDFMRSERGRFLEASDMEELILQSGQTLRGL
jgi:hypothetical protein